MVADGCENYSILHLYALALLFQHIGKSSSGCHSRTTHPKLEDLHADDTFNFGEELWVRQSALLTCTYTVYQYYKVPEVQYMIVYTCTLL